MDALIETGMMRVLAIGSVPLAEVPLDTGYLQPAGYVLCTVQVVTSKSGFSSGSASNTFAVCR